MTKENYLYDRLFVSNQNFTTEHVKIVQNISFFFNLSNSRFFNLKCQIPIFPGFEVLWQPC